MVYAIYASLVARSRINATAMSSLTETTIVPAGALQLWSKEVAARAWDRLGEVGLWMGVGTGEGRGRSVRCEVGLVELSGICERGKMLNSALKSWFKDGI
jgi:hypothetical protein